MVELEGHAIGIHEALNSQRFEVVDASSKVINLPLRIPMRLPFGEVSERPSGVLFLDLSLNKTIVRGVGEGATLSRPLFSDDYGEVIGQAINEIVEDLKTGPVNFSEAIRRIRLHRFRHEEKYPTARMTVEMAVIDALAKSLDKSVAEVLGIPSEMLEVPFGKSIGGGSIEEMSKEAEVAIGSNARKIKLKITPETARSVITVLNDIRNKHSDLELMIDANGTFDPMNTEHLAIIGSIDSQGLLMFEEPVSRVGEKRGIEAVKTLRNLMPNLRTPICLDDCLVDVQTTIQALTQGLADIINIKPGRIGSIMQAIDLAYVCKDYNKEIMVGGMLEATPGRMMTTVLASLFYTMGFRVPGDLSLAQDRLAEDLVAENQQLKIGPNGGIVIPRTKGWGFELQSSNN